MGMPRKIWLTQSGGVRIAASTKTPSTAYGVPRNSVGASTMPAIDRKKTSRPML